MMKALMPLTDPHVPHTWIQLRTSGALYIRVPEAANRLTRSSLIPWSRPGRRSSDTQHPRCWLHTSMWGPYIILTYIMSCFNENSHKLDQPVISTFYFDFRCDFEFSHQWVDNFGFRWPLSNHFVLKKLHNQFSTFVHWDPMCDLTVPFWAL